jgi:hypothetical protein
MADDIQNEVVTIHRAREVLKMLSFYTQISFAITCFVKKQQVQQSFLYLLHTRHKISLDGAGLCGLDVDSVIVLPFLH